MYSKIIFDVCIYFSNTNILIKEFSFNEYGKNFTDKIIMNKINDFKRKIFSSKYDVILKSVKVEKITRKEFLDYCNSKNKVGKYKWFIQSLE